MEKVFAETLQLYEQGVCGIRTGEYRQNWGHLLVAVWSPDV